MKQIIPTMVILILSILLLNSCKDNSVNPVPLPPGNENKITIKQGVWGNVWFWEGNFMPGPDVSSYHGTITPAIRDIYIYEATHFSEVELIDNIFIQRINSRLIKKVTSDKDGFFEISLEPGVYSIFAKEDSVFWGNERNGVGILMPAEVDTNSVVKRQININYKAVY